MNQKLQEFIRMNNAREFTNKDEGYDFLNEGDMWIQFINQNGSEDILLRIDENGILLYFDEWNYSFANDDEGVDQCIDECQSLFDDRSYVWKAEMNGQSFISLIRDEPGRFYEMCKQGFKASINGHMVEIDPNHIDQEFVFWDPSMMEPVQTPYLS